MFLIWTIGEKNIEKDAKNNFERSFELEKLLRFIPLLSLKHTKPPPYEMCNPNYFLIIYFST